MDWSQLLKMQLSFETLFFIYIKSYDMFLEIILVMYVRYFTLAAQLHLSSIVIYHIVSIRSTPTSQHLSFSILSPQEVPS